ncbi:POK9 protein, partial [Crotophaga sulcirostris]|nr:POK9 protein [Crotophaga sulcirostris]
HHPCLPHTTGKREEQREPPKPRRDTSSCGPTSANSNQPSFGLRPATNGSLGLDLAAAVDITLMTPQPTRIPTAVRGPITINSQPVGALLIGRSSTTLSGLFVLTGLIDADYTGEIQIMAYTPYPPICIKKGQRIAQLIPLPQLAKGITSLKQGDRGQYGFGSSGDATFAVLDLNSRPRRKISIQFQGSSHALTALLDTGADVSIIAPAAWPRDWPILASTATVTGVGGFTAASRSPPINVSMESKTAQVVFSIAQLPPGVQCLLGRDALAQLGFVL